MISDGAKAGINTVMVATPLLGGFVAFAVANSAARNAPLGYRALMGAVTGGVFSAIWEYTVNGSDAVEVKWEVIMGCTAIGAGAAAVGPRIKAQFF